MRRGRPKIKLSLTDNEKILLERTINESDLLKKERALFIVEASKGEKNMVELSQHFGRAKSTLQDWVAKWKKGKLSALMEIKKKPGRPPLLSEKEKNAIKKFRSETPPRSVVYIKTYLKGAGKSLSVASIYKYIKNLKQ